MTTRADRLRKAGPGLAEEDITALAKLGLADVDVIVKALRQARRDALAEAADRKRQRKADDREHGNYDESDFTRRNLAVVASQGRRATGGNLDALTALSGVRKHADTWIRWAVDGCRAEGLSDREIGVALGYPEVFARQEVHRRFGSRNAPGECRKNSYTG